MTTDRVALALKLLGVIRGGEPPTAEEFAALQGLTREERESAESLWAEGILAADEDL